MILQSFKRLYTNDYPQPEQDLVQRLAVPYNTLENVYNVLHNNVDLVNNGYVDVRTVNVAVDSKGNPTAITNLTLTNVTTAVMGTLVIRAVNTTNPNIYPTSTPFISFTPQSNANGITINNIAGLPTGNTFTLTIIVYG